MQISTSAPSNVKIQVLQSKINALGPISCKWYELDFLVIVLLISWSNLFWYNCFFPVLELFRIRALALFVRFSSA